MGFRSLAAVVGLLVVAACGGTEFAAANGEGGSSGEGGTSGGTGGASQGSSGGAGTATGAGGAGGMAGSVVDASIIVGSGGSTGVDGGFRPDASAGSGGTKVADASREVGAPDTGVVPTCPTAEPGGGGMCSGALKCTYGTHPRLSCRKTYTCTAGHWAIGASSMCTELRACTEENPLPFIGASCSSVGHDCMWDSGLYCRCVACPDMGCPNWNCFAPPNNCGTTPPNLGQPCDANSIPAVCEFGNCALGSRVTVTCVNGAINWTFPNCQ